MPGQALVLLLAQMMACGQIREVSHLLGLIMAALVHSESLSQTHLACFDCACSVNDWQ